MALAAVVVALLAVAGYLPTLNNGFAFDDVLMVADNQRIRSIDSVGGLFGEDWWGGRTDKSLLYRPLVLVTFAVDHLLVDGGPGRLPDGAAGPFHGTNLVWHALAALAALWFVRSLTGRDDVAASAAALFAVHPIHSEAVASIVGRAEAMAATFALVSLTLAWLSTGRASRPLAAMSGLFLLLGLLSKESVVVVPAITLLAVWVFRARGAWVRGMGPALTAQGLAVVTYLSVRLVVLGELLGTHRPGADVLDIDNPLVGVSAADRVRTVLSMQARIVELLVWPVNLSADYSYDEIGVVSSLQPSVVVGLLILGGGVWAAAASRRRYPIPAFGGLFFVATWFLTSNLPFPIGTIFGERLLFLPSLGICLLLGWAFALLPRRIRLPVLIIVAVLGVSRSWVRSRDWRDNATLFAATVQTSPRSVKARHAYGAALLEAGDPTAARKQLREALQIHPQYADAHQTMSRVYQRLAEAQTEQDRKAELLATARTHLAAAGGSESGSGDDGTARAAAAHAEGSQLMAEGRVAEAVAAFRVSVQAKPDSVDAMAGLGGALAARAEREPRVAVRGALYDEALTVLRQAVASDPGHADARQNLSTALLRAARNDPEAARGLRDEALRVERAALGQLDQADPGAARARVRLGQILAESGRLEEAVQEYRRARTLDPALSSAWAGEGAAAGRLAESAPDSVSRERWVTDCLAALQKALDLDPEDADVHLNLGLTYLRHRQDAARAVRHLKDHLRLNPGSPHGPMIEAAIRDLSR